MKNSLKDFRNASANDPTDISKNIGLNSDASPKIEKKIMTEQLVAPPAHVWDKIQNVLDQQDNRRKEGMEILAASLNKSVNSVSRRKQYFAAIAGTGAVATILWFIL